MSVWQPVYIGVGSNVDDPRHAGATLPCSSCTRFAGLRIVSVSPLYGSRPFGPIAQPDFVNAVVGALTWLEPRELLLELQKLEESLGRPARHQKWGPRVIDLDLLVYGSEQAAEPDLSLPHPGIARAKFRALPAR